MRFGKPMLFAMKREKLKNTSLSGKEHSLKLKTKKVTLVKNKRYKIFNKKNFMSRNQQWEHYFNNL